MQPTRRFTGRARAYTLYRPGYPPGLVPFLVSQFQLTPQSRLVDLGSGTGKLTEIFVRAGYPALGVEPNDAMRSAAEESLGDLDGFTSLSGTAESVPLERGSVDAIVAAQAFHWFDQAKARVEFLRLLRRPAYVALIWNNRRTEQSEFLHAYDEMLRVHCPEYDAIGNKHYDEAELQRFFGGDGPRLERFHYVHELDRDQLVGRVMSCSYAPASGPEHTTLMSAIDALFTRYTVAGRVRMDYDTFVHYGALT